ncbi:MAG: hypothetical protein ACQEUM_18105 [Pseudomonadota bacterium]
MAVEAINDARHQAEVLQQAIQDQAFEKAQEQVEAVRRFIGTPENILGNHSTKHGEIAEQVEVGIRNARSAVNQADMMATFDGVGRTARADYMIDGLDVQSKFYNGARNSLDGILNHLEKYPDFTGSDGYYHIPKDQHEEIRRLLSGEQVGDLNDKTIRAIQSKVEEVERQSGRPFAEVVQPGSSDYSDVQQGVIHDTLDSHDDELRDTNSQLKETIHQEHQASLTEGLKATGVAAGLGGGIALGTALYGKYREGKNPFAGDFTRKDWADVGVTTSKGATGGAVAGASLYALTNYAGMGAPFAAAIVSTGKGVAALSMQLKQGDIDTDEFVELGTVVCAEAAIVALATVAGQVAIPLPVVGSVVGSLSGRFLAEVAINTPEAVSKRLEADMQALLDRLEEEHKGIMLQIHAEFDALGSLMDAAFQVELNYGLRERSLALATTLGVPEDQLIHNDSELDDFMLS